MHRGDLALPPSRRSLLIDASIRSRFVASVSAATLAPSVREIAELQLASWKKDGGWRCATRRVIVSEDLDDTLGEHSQRYPPSLPHLPFSLSRAPPYAVRYVASGLPMSRTNDEGSVDIENPPTSARRSSAVDTSRHRVWSWIERTGGVWAMRRDVERWGGRRHERW